MDATTKKIFGFLQQKGFQPRTDFWINEDGLIDFSERAVKYITNLFCRNLNREQLFDLCQDLRLSLKEEL